MSGELVGLILLVAIILIAATGFGLAMFNKGADKSALAAAEKLAAAEHAKSGALQKRVEIDHEIEQAMAGGAADLAALARAAGLQRRS